MERTTRELPESRFSFACYYIRLQRKDVSQTHKRETSTLVSELEYPKATRQKRSLPGGNSDIGAYQRF